MRKEYRKLVRDNIPELIRSSGKECETEIISLVEYGRALLAKLVEEAEEASLAKTRMELVEELADIYEVLEALLVENKVNIEEVQAVQQHKRNEKGSFDRRIRLISVTRL